MTVSTSGCRRPTRSALDRSLAIGLLILSGLLSGCVSGDGSSTLSPSPREASSFGHVHGLGVHPGTGVVYAATHAGVFELPAIAEMPVAVDELSGPIAGRSQDTMGFVMVGDVMFASGHPDPMEDPSVEPDLGLIQSVDSGQEWRSISLAGEADFHDLVVVEVAGGPTTVYGYEASREIVMVSLDGGVSWSEGATLALRDLTVDPAFPGTVYATTAAGLAISTDYGGSFTLLPNAPVLTLVEATPDTTGSLVGVGDDGTIWRKPGATADWQPTGTAVGVVEAMTFALRPQPVLVVADDRGIVVSADWGLTWASIAVL
jgi:hypothetical protein